MPLTAVVSFCALEDTTESSKQKRINIFEYEESIFKDRNTFNTGNQGHVE